MTEKEIKNELDHQIIENIKFEMDKKFIVHFGYQGISVMEWQPLPGFFLDYAIPMDAFDFIEDVKKDSLKINECCTMTPWDFAELLKANYGKPEYQFKAPGYTENSTPEYRCQLFAHRIISGNSGTEQAIKENAKIKKYA